MSMAQYGYWLSRWPKDDANRAQFVTPITFRDCTSDYRTEAAYAGAFIGSAEACYSAHTSSELYRFDQLYRM